MFAFLKNFFGSRPTSNPAWTIDDELKMVAWKSDYYRFDRFF